MKRAIFIAPHHDDEILGCGGTILRKKNDGYKTSLIFVTNMFKNNKNIRKKDKILNSLQKQLKLNEINELSYEATSITKLNIKDLVSDFSKIFKRFKPTEVYLPHYNDIHSDHKIVSDAGLSCTKWYRFPHIKKILAYETLSETNFSKNDSNSFRPNYYVNISKFFSKKINLIKLYKSEFGKHPFPRSKESVTSLANLRGSESGFKKSEAFQILKEIH